MKKKSIRMALLGIVALLLISSLLPSTIAYASRLASDSAESIFKDTEYFKDYEDYLISEEPVISKETTDIDENVIGWITQYEVLIENESSVLEGEAVEKVTSALTFVYHNETESVEAYLNDYSRILSDEAVFFIDLVNNTEESIPLEELENPGLIELKDEISVKKEELETVMEVEAAELEENAPSTYSTTPNAIDCRWWVCTATSSGGGHTYKPCALVLGTACSIFGNKVPYSKLICNPFGIAISCWVPSYTICINGYYETKFCPIQS